MAKREVDQETFSPRTFPLDAFEMREEGNQKTLIMVPPWAFQGLEHMHPVSSTNYTILDDDGVTVLPVTTGASNRTITLPTAADNKGRVVTVIKVDTGSGSVIVDGESTEKIGIEGNALTFDLYAQGDRVTLVSDGTLWLVLETNGPEIVYKSASNVNGSTTSDTWANPTSHSVTLPAGVWVPMASVMVSIGYTAGARGTRTWACLSTANNSATNGELIGGVASTFLSGSTIVSARSDYHTIHGVPIVVASSTPYYLNIKGYADGNPLTSINTSGTSITTVIRFKRVG